jgi:hypothetical protein
VRRRIGFPGSLSPPRAIGFKLGLRIDEPVSNFDLHKLLGSQSVALMTEPRKATAIIGGRQAYDFTENSAKSSDIE